MRIRTIKPSFFANDELAEIHPLTRLLFIGLWCMADVKGRLAYRPKKIKAAILPYDDHDIEAAMSDLHARGFINCYHAEGTNIVQIVNFGKHQRINGKESFTESIFPEWFPGTSPIQIGEAESEQPGSNGEATEKQPGSNREHSGTLVIHTGREGKGREGKGVYASHILCRAAPDAEKVGGVVYPEQPAKIAGSQPPFPPAPPVSEKRKTAIGLAMGILEYLNAAAGRAFRATPCNLKLIALRLEEIDNDADGVRAMIDRMVAKWKPDAKMSEYLRPETLFGRSKFGSYYDTRALPVPTASPSQMPIGIQIRSAEALLETLSDRLAKIYVPDPNLDPSGHKAAMEKRRPLVDEKRTVAAKLNELRKQAIG